MECMECMKLTGGRQSYLQEVCFQVHMIDEIIRGLVSTPMENMDQFVTGEITNHLFEDHHIPHSGVDLIALNIQRGKVSVDMML